MEGGHDIESIANEVKEKKKGDQEKETEKTMKPPAEETADSNFIGFEVLGIEILF